MNGADQHETQRIRPSRFVAGIALHFAVPAYLIWLAVALLPFLGDRGNRDELAAAAGRASLQFLFIYAVVLVAVTLTVRAMEPTLRQVRERRDARDPRTAARQSEARLRSALRIAAALDLSDAAQRLQQAPWRHADSRFQAVSADLARAANAFSAAFANAPADQRAEARALATGAFNRIAEAVEQLAEEQRRLDHGDARTLARYIELRYPSSDFAGEQNS